MTWQAENAPSVLFYFLHIFSNFHRRRIKSDWIPLMSHELGLFSDDKLWQHPKMKKKPIIKQFYFVCTCNNNKFPFFLSKYRYVHECQIPDGLSVWMFTSRVAKLSFVLFGYGTFISKYTVSSTCADNDH